MLPDYKCTHPFDDPRMGCCYLRNHFLKQCGYKYYCVYQKEVEVDYFNKIYE